MKLKLNGIMETKSPRRKLYDGVMMSSTYSLLRWANEDNRGILSSGWNFRNKGHVFFKDEMGSLGKITLIIEPPIPFNALSLASAAYESYWHLKGPDVETRATAHGYFFEKNVLTGKIDLIHRLKPYNGKEERNAYRDCTYFGLTLELTKDSNGVVWEERMFTLTSGYSDKLFPIGANLNPHSSADLTIMVAAVNALIYSVQGHIEIAANARLHRLFCTGLEYENQCREHEASVLQHKYEDDCGPFATDSIEDSNKESERNYIDMTPYYLKPSAVRIIRSNEIVKAIDGEGINQVEMTEDVTAICIGSSLIMVDARI